MEGFTVYPAIDVLDGRCVRLAEGRREHVTVEGGDPLAAALRFSAAGATWLHLVDLDGAFSGVPTPGLVRLVARAGVPVQAGGGLREPAAVQDALDAGAARAIVGTAALGDLERLTNLFGDRLVVAVDTRDGRVVTEGWTSTSALSAGEFAGQCAAAGVARLLVTSTRRDGSLAGPDLGLLEDVRAAGVPVIAAGGISSLDDLVALRALGCEGAVVGSAIWTGRLELAEALATAEEGQA